MMRREKDREKLQALALSFCASIGAVMGGGNSADIIRPFYSRPEWDYMETRMAASRARAEQEAQLAELRRVFRNA